LLHSPAPRQLLVYHHDVQFREECFPSLAKICILLPEEKIPAGPTKLRQQLMTELEAMGSYPNKLRKVAFANGSGTGRPQQIRPGDLMLAWLDFASQANGVKLIAQIHRLMIYLSM
jgi:hypothetical protein